MRNGSDASGDFGSGPLSNRFFYTDISMPTSLSFLTDDQKPKPEIIPYSKEAMRQDLDRVREAWAVCQCCRQRDAIYGYLTAVYDLVTWWAAEQRDVERARRALWSRRLEVSRAGGPIRRDHPVHGRPGQSGQAHSKQVVEGYAVRDRGQGSGRAVQRFVVRKGGINKCASRYTRLLKTAGESLAAKRRQQLSGCEPSGKT